MKPLALFAHVVGLAAFTVSLTLQLARLAFVDIEPWSIASMAVMVAAIIGLFLPGYRRLSTTHAKQLLYVKLAAVGVGFMIALALVLMRVAPSPLTLILTVVALATAVYALITTVHIERLTQWDENRRDEQQYATWAAEDAARARHPRTGTTIGDLTENKNPTSGV